MNEMQAKHVVEQWLCSLGQPSEKLEDALWCLAKRLEVELSPLGQYLMIRRRLQASREAPAWKSEHDAPWLKMLGELREHLSEEECDMLLEKRKPPSCPHCAELEKTVEPCQRLLEWLRSVEMKQLDDLLSVCAETEGTMPLLGVLWELTRLKDALGSKQS